MHRGPLYVGAGDHFHVGGQAPSAASAVGERGDAAVDERLPRGLSGLPPGERPGGDPGRGPGLDGPVGVHGGAEDVGVEPADVPVDGGGDAFDHRRVGDLLGDGSPGGRADAAPPPLRGQVGKGGAPPVPVSLGGRLPDHLAAVGAEFVEDGSGGPLECPDSAELELVRVTCWGVLAEPLGDHPDEGAFHVPVEIGDGRGDAVDEVGVDGHSHPPLTL